MLKNICYSLMAGCLLTLIAWMARQNAPADARLTKEGITSFIRGSAPKQTAWDAQTDDLIAWVDHYDLDSPTYQSDWLDLDFRSHFDEVNQSSSNLNMESGMSRDEVRQTLGEPLSTENEEDRWVYPTVTVLFDDDDAVMGWLDTDQKDSVHQAIRNVMMPSTVPTPKKRQEEETVARRWTTPPLYISGGGRSASRGTSGGHGAYGHRRPLDRLLDRSSRNAYYGQGPFRRPQYLRGMFPNRSRSSRNSNRYDPY